MLEESFNGNFKDEVFSDFNKIAETDDDFCKELSIEAGYQNLS